MVGGKIVSSYKMSDHLSQQVQDTIKNFQNLNRKYSNIALITHKSFHSSDLNIPTNILQDEIKNKHDVCARLEKENNDLVKDKERSARKIERLEQEKKHYKETISNTQSAIESMLNRRLQADDHNHPYLTDSIDQLLLSVRQSLKM